MFNTTTVTLNPSYLSLNVNAVAPFEIKIDPQGADLSKKVYKITYDFGDGSPLLVKKLAPLPLQVDTSLPFFSEPLDPRNSLVSHVYSLKENTTEVFVVKIKVYPIEDAEITDNYTEFTINLKISAPILYTPEIKSNKTYFESIHLVSTRMFGPDNTILYGFESVNPQYLLPTIVKWHKPYDETNPPPFKFDPINDPR